MPTFLNRIFRFRGLAAVSLLGAGAWIGGFVAIAISAIGATLLVLSDEQEDIEREEAEREKQDHLGPLLPAEPISTQNDAPAAVVGILSDKTRRSSTRGRETTLRVLVCEDDSLVRNLVMYILERRGYAAVATENARRALEVTDEGASYDALLTDIRMPGMDGLALASRLRERRPDLPVVFMTGFAQVMLSDPSLQSPHTILLAKPFRPADLQRALQDACGEQRALTSS